MKQDAKQETLLLDMEKLGMRMYIMYISDYSQSICSMYCIFTTGFQGLKTQYN